MAWPACMPPGHSLSVLRNLSINTHYTSETRTRCDCPTFVSLMMMRNESENYIFAFRCVRTCAADAARSVHKSRILLADNTDIYSTNCCVYSNVLHIFISCHHIRMPSSSHALLCSVQVLQQWRMPNEYVWNLITAHISHMHVARSHTRITIIVVKMCAHTHIHGINDKRLICDNHFHFHHSLCSRLRIHLRPAAPALPLIVFLRVIVTFLICHEHGTGAFQHATCCSLPLHSRILHHAYRPISNVTLCCSLCLYPNRTKTKLYPAMRETVRAWCTTTSSDGNCYYNRIKKWTLKTLSDVKYGRPALMRSRRPTQWC